MTSKGALLSEEEIAVLPSSVPAAISRQENVAAQGFPEEVAATGVLGGLQPLALPASTLASRNRLGTFLFLIVLAGGVFFSATRLLRDLELSPAGSVAPYLLLGIALLIALSFEFVNGFHDTANAVATVIYTRALSPHVAVVWSGLWNFIGVLASSGAVAFSILSLLPVELILQVGRGAGFAMVFALLVAAILWNLGTWWLGLPASSSHTMIGSIMGVGLANQWMSTPSGTSGMDWAQAEKVFKALLFSPLLGLLGAGLLLTLFRVVVRDRQLYRAPSATEPPPLWIRALLVLTCTGVSFAHGSNDGQKGMGLIMLILIGTVPAAYALNHAVTPAEVQAFLSVSAEARQVIVAHENPTVQIGDARGEVTRYVRTRQIAPATLSSLTNVMTSISRRVSSYDDLRKVPAAEQGNLRNDMFVVSESLRLMGKSGRPSFSPQETQVLDRYRQSLDHSTKFIPTWVKVAVALALGLGTMVGWKRIVVTVGERIGKRQLTYAQGASAEIVAMGTILAADQFGLPVSTTHVLSSGIAGTMAASKSGLQMRTIRNIAAAWVLTLPVAALLSGCLFWLFRHFSF